MTGWDTRLDRIIGAAGTKLAKAKNLHTAGDLLDFLPRRYLDVNQAGLLSEFEIGEQVVLVARVIKASTRPMRNTKRKMLEAVIEDAVGQRARLVFFSAYGHEKALVPGVGAVFYGKLESYRGDLQLAHPSYSRGDLDAPDLYPGNLMPVYPHIDKIPDVAITRSVTLVLDALAAQGVRDPVPDDILDRHHLPRRLDAYRALHLPVDYAQVGRGKRRLRYDEALVVQVALAQRRAQYDALRTTARRPRPAGLLERFDQRLPFELTQGQREVSATILADLARERPMHRLLQGEVGSGKTVVALRAMLAMVDAGAQAALLAPTEVLAQQHFRSIETMLGDLAQGGMLGGAEHATRVALLTGSMPKARKQQVLLDIFTAGVGIVVGTHALIQEQVDFADLGLVVVDEQHRFGVEQRDALRMKAISPPHVLVMTATPIPRTVAMTVFGDMDISELRELPPGRQQITSHLVPAAKPGWLERTWQRVAEEVAAGHQAYVVCPRIGEEGDSAQPEEELPEWALEVEESGTADTTPRHHGVIETLATLRQEPALAGLRIEMMHGRMSSAEKDAVMSAFSAGEIDVLVSTTVIEVGVDVPNATIMVILDADRFGISQLHQLRGRVGRGSGGGLALLVTDSSTEATVDRLAKVAATTDGFALADLDLELRREGDVLGADQSGRGTHLRLLRLTNSKDVELIELAREDAARLIADDPELEVHPALAALIAGRVDEERAAFLERG
ncbi:ATP-dependent DNA helicase RecG [Branchiibius sp. NY16-3462-2]|nr:ATP-dependent DNA helicase RecG [Branchiibius sp. NY16-3462-2]